MIKLSYAALAHGGARELLAAGFPTALAEDVRAVLALMPYDGTVPAGRMVYRGGAGRERRDSRTALQP
jgi:hypothetical protein